MDQRGDGKRACGVFTRGNVARFGVCVCCTTHTQCSSLTTCVASRVSRPYSSAALNVGVITQVYPSVCKCKCVSTTLSCFYFFSFHFNFLCLAGGDIKFARDGRGVNRIEFGDGF